MTPKDLPLCFGVCIDMLSFQIILIYLLTLHLVLERIQGCYLELRFAFQTFSDEMKEVVGFPSTDSQVDRSGSVHGFTLISGGHCKGFQLHLQRKTKEPLIP